MRGSVVGFSLIAALLLAACGASAGHAGDPAKGRELFTTGGASAVPCATCHTLNGSATLVGPSLEGIAARAGSRIAGVSAQDYIRQSIQNPSAHLVDGFSDNMYKKYFETLSGQDIDDLVAFLMTQ